MFCGSLESLHHAIGDDVACVTAFTAHDAAAHRIGAEPALSDASPGHCLFCHWTRAFRPAPSSAKRLTARQSTPAGRIVHAAVTLAAAPELSRLPARAPPQVS
jgi:hypothetical protein